MEPDFWNSDDSKKVVLKLNELKKIVSKVDGFSDLEHSLRESLADSELLSIVAEEIENLFKEVNDFEILNLVNSIIWILLHYGGSIIREMTYQQPFMYSPDTGAPNCCRTLFLKKLGP